MKNLLLLLLALFFVPSTFAQIYDQQSGNICQAFSYRQYTFTGATEATQNATLSVTWRYCGPWNGNDYGYLTLQIWVNGSWVSIVNNFYDTGNGCAYNGIVDNFTISSATINAAINTAPVGEILIRGQIADGCSPGVGCDFGSDPCFKAQLTYSNAASANFSGSTNSICLGDVVTITDASAGSNLTYAWDFGTDANPPTASGVGPHDVTYTTPGTKTISLEVENGSGTNSTSQNIEVYALPSINTSANVAICPGSSTLIEAFGTGTITWDNGLGAGASFTVSPTVTTEYVATIVDFNSCSANSSTIVTVNDNDGPIPNVGTLADVIDQCEVTSLTAPTATDNCAGTITGTHNASFPITSNTTITWIYDDGNGNTSTQTQNVVINDVTAPVADVGSLANMTDQCEVTSLTAPTATDNCAGMITGTHNASFPITASTTVTWTYDDGNGNISTQTQDVVVNDNTAPVADAGSLADVTDQCEVTSLTAPTATDNCAGMITGTHNASFPITASTTVTWTYDDGNGNTSTQTQNVVINDVTAPVADVGSLANVTDQCEVTSLTAPTATDNCAGMITGTHNAQFPITSSATVTWTFDDGNGNTSAQTQNVEINDFTAPVPDAANLADVNDQCEVPFLTAPTATDNCAGSITGTHNALLPITSSITVTWTFDDGNGNTSTQTQDVIINDVTAPVPTVANLPAISDECEITSLIAPTANDNCEGAITGIQNASLPITTSTTITWTYDDGNGNISAQTQEAVITPIDNSITQLDPITLMADVSGYNYQWVDCNSSNAPVQGETGQGFVAINNGSYAVEIDNGTCTVTSDCIQILTVGITNAQVDPFHIYPNPTTDIFYLKLDQSGENVNILVKNMLGMDVTAEVTQTNDLISVRLNGANGMYLVQVETGSTIVTQKVSIQ